MTEKNQSKKALWIFPNFKESIDELPKSQRALVWQAVCEIGLGYDFDIKKCTTSQKMCIKLIYPLLKLRNVGGSIVSGEKRNPEGKNGLNDCNKTISEDNPYPNPSDNPIDNPEDNPLFKKEIRNKEQEKEKEKEKKKDIFLDEFEKFWKEFTPVKCNGRFVDKGSKKTAYEKYVKILEKGEKHENIIRGTREYISHCQANNQLTCGATVFLNQERWKCDYGATIDGNSRTEHGESRSILETYAEIALEYK